MDLDYLDLTDHASGSFYSRNARLAPRPKARRKRIWFGMAVLLLGTGAAALSAFGHLWAISVQ